MVFYLDFDFGFSLELISLGFVSSQSASNYMQLIERFRLDWFRFLNHHPGGRQFWVSRAPQSKAPSCVICLGKLSLIIPMQFYSNEGYFNQTMFF